MLQGWRFLFEKMLLVANVSLAVLCAGCLWAATTPTTVKVGGSGLGPFKHVPQSSDMESRSRASSEVSVDMMPSTVSLVIHQAPPEPLWARSRIYSAPQPPQRQQTKNTLVSEIWVDGDPSDSESESVASVVSQGRQRRRSISLPSSLQRHVQCQMLGVQRTLSSCRSDGSVGRKRSIHLD